MDIQNILTLLTLERLGVLFGILGAVKIFDWFFKERSKLERYVQEDSFDLVNEVLMKWFIPSPDIHIALPDSYIIQTPLHVIIYRAHSRSEELDYIDLCIEKNLLKYSCQAKDHLKEYSKSHAWVECERISHEYLNDVVEIYKTIEDKIIENIPVGFTEEHNYYILDKTVDAIYRESKRFAEKGWFYDLFKIVSEDGCFKVVDSDSIPYAVSSEEHLVNEFKELVYIVAKDPINVARIKQLIDIEKQNVNRFKNILNKIKDDVERGHVNLKGSCKRCKSWRFKLKYYYNIKMFIIIGLLLLVSYVLVKNTI